MSVRYGNGNSAVDVVWRFHVVSMLVVFARRKEGKEDMRAALLNN